jgi:hypothetical protein
MVVVRTYPGFGSRNRHRIGSEIGPPDTHKSVEPGLPAELSAANAGVAGGPQPENCAESASAGLRTLGGGRRSVGPGNLVRRQFQIPASSAPLFADLIERSSLQIGRSHDNAQLDIRLEGEKPRLG